MLRERIDSRDILEKKIGRTWDKRKDLGNRKCSTSFI